MPRLFTALEIPPDVRAAISAVRGGLPGARWIDPENYHVTLRFIGDVDESVAHEAAFILGQVRREAFEIKLDTLSSFGSHRPRAIVALVSPSRPLLELQAEQERLLRRIGLEPEGRKFTPHVTVARLRDSSSHQVAEYFSARGHFRAPVFEPERFVLFSSRDSVGGGPYVVEADYPFLEAMPHRRLAQR
jgi:RNA 2',3'-cyclic 3'-phosphodiesterase